MKKSGKIALGGVLSAMAVVIMLVAYFPYFTYAVPALAGIVFAVISIEIGRKWAFLSYIACAIVTLILCEKESATLFAGFFGYYVILKGVIEQHFKGFLEHFIKQAVFSAAMILCYFVVVYIFGIPFDDDGLLGQFLAPAMLVAGNIVFYIYDIGVTRVLTAYIIKLHPKISKMFR